MRFMQMKHVMWTTVRLFIRPRPHVGSLQLSNRFELNLRKRLRRINDMTVFSPGLVQSNTGSSPAIHRLASAFLSFLPENLLLISENKVLYQYQSSTSGSTLIRAKSGFSLSRTEIRVNPQSAQRLEPKTWVSPTYNFQVTSDFRIHPQDAVCKHARCTQNPDA